MPLPRPETLAALILLATAAPALAHDDHAHDGRAHADEADAEAHAYDAAGADDDDHAHDDHAHDDHAEGEHAGEEHAEGEHAHDEHAEGEHAHDDHAGEEHAGDDHAGDADPHLATAGGLRLVHAWSRATDRDETLVFVEIENAGDSTRSLIGGSSPHAAAAEIVGFRLVDGAPVYQPLPEVPIAPGAEMTLAPEGLALRLTGLDAALEEGGVLPVTFAFDDGLDIEATAQIEAENATRHSHAGHMH